MADSAPAQPRREVPAVVRISSMELSLKWGMHNNSQELTWLAGKSAKVLGPPRCARMGGVVPEPPGSSARIR